MEPTTFGFSKWVAWSGMLFFTGMLTFILLMGFGAPSTKIWLYLLFPLLLVLGLLIAFLKWSFIPMLQRRITLELDEEKAQCYLSGKVIYWKDVVEMTDHYARYSSWIEFDMVNGEQQTISTKWIEGSTKSIRKKMEEYFARTL